MHRSDKPTVTVVVEHSPAVLVVSSSLKHENVVVDLSSILHRGNALPVLRSSFSRGVRNPTFLDANTTGATSFLAPIPSIDAHPPRGTARFAISNFRSAGWRLSATPASVDVSQSIPHCLSFGLCTRNTVLECPTNKQIVPWTWLTW